MAVDEDTDPRSPVLRGVPPSGGPAGTSSPPVLALPAGLHAKSSPPRGAIGVALPRSPSSSGAFSTPLIDQLFKQERHQEAATGPTGGAGSPAPTSRLSIDVKKGTGKKLDISVIDHPSETGVVVCSLGENGACSDKLKIGDHITKINGIRARDHRTAMWLADAADKNVTFTLSDATHSVLVDRLRGDVGVTLVDNIAAGLGVVVVAVVPGLAADRAGLEKGHVILSVNGELARQHRQVIQQIDGSSEIARLVVAARKLTDQNVMSQHVGQCPCEIRLSE